jgi:hypothetical protein
MATEPVQIVRRLLQGRPTRHVIDPPPGAGNAMQLPNDTQSVIDHLHLPTEAGLEDGRRGQFFT